MMDENDRSHEDYRSLRHISRKEGSEDTAPIEVDSSAFFSELPPEQPSTPPPAQPPQKPPRSGHNTPVPPKAQPPVDGAVAVPSKWGKILLILQGILSILALVQLWRTQMLPVLYLVILAALLALLWLLVKRCQEYNVPGKVARVFSVFLCAAMALGCFWAQQGLSALGSMTSGLLTGAEANKITKEPFVIYLSGVDTRGELTENARSDVNILAAGRQQDISVRLRQEQRCCFRIQHASKVRYLVRLLAQKAQIFCPCLRAGARSALGDRCRVGVRRVDHQIKFRVGEHLNDPVHRDTPRAHRHVAPFGQERFTVFRCYAGRDGDRLGAQKLHESARLRRACENADLTHFCTLAA